MVPLLHFTERGLQRVGFGFMMGAGGGNVEQQPMDSSAVSSAGNTGSKSDGSDGEEDVISLASTAEEKFGRIEIAENELYIKELEERERLLAENVEELLNKIRETEAEVGRWREACELEVEAGKNEIGERDKVVMILQQELERTREALDVSNGKLKLKDDLVSAAMAAQEPAEKSLELADSRAGEQEDSLRRSMERTGASVKGSDTSVGPGECSR